MSCAKFIRKFPHKGAATLEFALALPAFLLLIFSIVDLARYYFMEQSISHTLRAAARYAVTGQLASNASYNAAVTNSFPYMARKESILAAARSNNPGFLLINCTTTNSASTNAPSGTDNFLIATSGASGGPWTNNMGGQGGQFLKLSLTNDFNFVTPFLDLIVTNLAGQTFKIGSSLILKSENFSSNEYSVTNSTGRSTNYWN